MTTVNVTQNVVRVTSSDTGVVAQVVETPVAVTVGGSVPLAGSSDTPIIDGTADVGSGIRAARWDHVHPMDAGLLSIAGLTTAADEMIYTTASDTYAVTTLTAFGRSLVDDADAATARSTLGLGTMATQAASSVAITGGTINGTAIGGSTPAAGTFTTVTASSSLQIGTGSDYSYISPGLIDMASGGGSYGLAISESGGVWSFENFNGIALKILDNRAVNATSALTVGTDPGGSQILRVGGSGVFSGVLTVSDTTASVSTVTGCATFAGGIGVAGALNVGASIVSSKTGTALGAGVLVDSANPAIALNESDQAADAKLWDITSNGSNFRIRAWNDAQTVANTAYNITRSGAAVTAHQFVVGGVSSVTIGATTMALASGVKLTVSDTTASVSTVTGCATFAGGVGIAGALNVGGASTFSGSVKIDVNGVADVIIDSGSGSNGRLRYLENGVDQIYVTNDVANNQLTIFDVVNGSTIAAFTQSASPLLKLGANTKIGSFASSVGFDTDIDLNGNDIVDGGAASFSSLSTSGKITAAASVPGSFADLAAVQSFLASIFN